MKNRNRIPDWDETFTFYKGEAAWYCVYSNGIITRTWLKSLREEKVSIYLNKGKAMFKAGQKNFVLKHVVAAAFLPEYKKGESVVCKDGNELNCAIKNLKVMTKTQLGKETGHLAGGSTPVLVTDPHGYKRAYRSVREAARALNCSYQTVLDFMGGKVKRSCLEGYKIDRRYD